MSTKRYHVFSHCTADRAASYRQVLSAFTRAKECFVLHLRSLELANQLEMSEQEVQSLLRQLLEWGNLTSLNDTTEVATVEEFYQPRYLYQLSADGEAAERALAVFEEALEQPGELQATALLDIRDLLRQLGREEDPARISLTLASLRERFEQLTARAQVFMGSLQRSLDLFSLSEEGLIGYKELLVDYLERFVSQLVTTSAEIARELEQLSIGPLLEVAARREAEDALDKQAAFERVCLQWSQRWAGLRSWFLGGSQGPAQSEVLRNRARTAVTSLLAAITTVNDRRSNKSDRFSDYCTLARWFAQADSRQAHRLWRSAFGLSPARHLYIDEATLSERSTDPISPQTRWAEAPPLQISVRFRKTGTHAKRGRQSAVTDRSQHKLLLAELARAETEELERARLRLADGQRRRLSQLHRLDPAELDLLLDALGTALSERGAEDEPVEAVSTDGSLHIRLEPAEGQAEIQSSLGVLAGRDHYLTLSPR